MKKTILQILLVCLAFQANFAQNAKPATGGKAAGPSGYDAFFKAVQMAHVFPDSKTFPDCTPKFPLAEIAKRYEQQRSQPDFGLREFVLAHYTLPHSYSSDFKADTGRSAVQHINVLWDVLTRQPEAPVPGSSLIPLPHAYVVPGGRFGEVYYWDSYFTMLGLEVSKRTDLIRNMVDNFAYLIDTVGFIPNGNRTYYLTRSQPPFFAMMVQLLANAQGKETYGRYLPQLEKEYVFWMSGTNKLGKQNGAFRRVVRMPGGEILNRYWDDSPTPRPESYREDVETADLAIRQSAKTSKNAQNAQNINQLRESVYRNLRAGAESGWDFSSRWFRDGKTLATIRTTEIVPVDLNCLLYNLEQTLATAYETKGNAERAGYYRNAAEKRRQAVFAYCWDNTAQFFTDYDFTARRTTGVYSLAGMFPFFFGMGIGTPQTAASRIERDFLKDGGLITTLANTGQQWDAPNGWAPLQWIAYKALKDSGFAELAGKIKTRWVTNNVRVYKQTGKMVEKYNVTDITLKAGGGEYPVQDGFGWTNGVLLRMLSEKE